MNGINKTLSPCIEVCKDEPETQRTCSGCGRTFGEIEEWPTASKARKREIVKAAKVRRTKKS